MDSAAARQNGPAALSESPRAGSTRLGKLGHGKACSFQVTNFCEIKSQTSQNACYMEGSAERIVVDGEIANPRAVVAIAKSYDHWFPQLHGRIGQLIARHFSGSKSLKSAKFLNCNESD